jgi:hypothetical protein
MPQPRLEALVLRLPVRIAPRRVVRRSIVPRVEPVVPEEAEAMASRFAGFPDWVAGFLPSEDELLRRARESGRDVAQ